MSSDFLPDEPSDNTTQHVAGRVWRPPTPDNNPYAPSQYAPSAYQPQSPRQASPAIGTSNWPAGNAQWHLSQTAAGASIHDRELGEIALHSRSGGEILGLAIRFARARFGQLWLVTLMLVSPVVIVNQLISRWIGQQATDTTSSIAMFDAQTSSEVATKVMLASMAILFLGFVTSIVASTLAIRSAAQRMLADLVDQSRRIVTARRAVIASVGFGVALLLVLIVPVGLTTLLAGPALPTLFVTIPGSIAVIILGSLLIVAMLPVFVSEGSTTSVTLRRTRSLRRGASGRLLGIIVLNRVLQWFVAAFVSVPGVVVSLVIDNDTVLFAIGVVAALLASVFDVLVTGFAVALWYFDCRVRNEAFDVQVMSAQVAAQVAGETR